MVTKIKKKEEKLFDFGCEKAELKKIELKLALKLNLKLKLDKKKEKERKRSRIQKVKKYGLVKK